MEALVACYGDGSSDSDSDSQSSSLSNQTLAYSEGRAPLPPRATQACVQPLPPPPVELLHPPNFLGMAGFKLIFVTCYSKEKREITDCVGPVHSEPLLVDGGIGH